VFLLIAKNLIREMGNSLVTLKELIDVFGHLILLLLVGSPVPSLHLLALQEVGHITISHLYWLVFKHEGRTVLLTQLFAVVLQKISVLRPQNAEFPHIESLLRIFQDFSEALTEHKNLVAHGLQFAHNKASELVHLVAQSIYKMQGVVSKFL
jgi:hypothetical protein